MLRLRDVAVGVTTAGPEGSLIAGSFAALALLIKLAPRLRNP
jgi:hypothetical protein